MKPFIEVKNVWQEYGDQVVLERLNLSINEGEFCTLIGFEEVWAFERRWADPE